VFDLAAKRQLNRGYSDGLSRAIEIVVTPLLFGLLGHLLDAWLGTEPVLMIVVGAFGVVGLFVKLWLGYDRSMREHEAQLPGASAASSAAAAGDGAGGHGEGGST
jgi:F0F1-type ATP synthase assembly protein I